MKIATSYERINELLDSDPRSLTAIADDLGVSKQAVSAWKTGVRSPKKSVLIKIAETYHVSVEWLMGFDVERNGEEHPLFVPDAEIFRKIILSLSPEDYRTVMQIFEKAEQRLRQLGKL